MLNLLLQNTDLANAVWTKGGVSISGSLVTAVTSSYGAVYQTATVISGAPYTMVALVSPGNQGKVALELRGASAAPQGFFNVSTGTLTSGAGTLADAGSGRYLIVVNAAASSASAIGLISTNGAVSVSGETINVHAVGVFAGTWTAAQILAEGGIPTTTATAASNASAGKYWWSFDGSNDSLLSGNLGITNACTIVVAGRVNSLGAIQVLLCEDVNGVVVYISATGAIVLNKYGIGDLVSSSAGAIVAGVPFVITARLSSGTAVIRNLGVQIATAATALTFSATTGARIGTGFSGASDPTNGALGWVVPIAAALSDADCLTVERLVSSQFPNGPVF